jgi:hypothetical protein
VIMDEARMSSLYELKALGQKSGSFSSKKVKSLRNGIKFLHQLLLPDEWRVFKSQRPW